MDITAIFTSQMGKLKYKNVEFLDPNMGLVKTKLRIKPRLFGSRPST